MVDMVLDNLGLLQVDTVLHQLEWVVMEPLNLEVTLGHLVMEPKEVYMSLL